MPCQVRRLSHAGFRQPQPAARMKPRFPPGNDFAVATPLAAQGFPTRDIPGPKTVCSPTFQFQVRGGVAMKVREIMTSDPRTATPDTTLVEIATLMKDEDVGVIPIIDDERIAGVVSDRDIVIRCIATGKDPNDCTAEDVMSSDVKTIEAEADVDDAADIMSEAQIRRLAVVKNGKLVGMLSLGDIAVKASDEDETTAETLED